MSQRAVSTQKRNQGSILVLESGEGKNYEMRRVGRSPGINIQKLE